MSHTPGPWKAVYVGSSDWDLDGPVTEQDWKLAAAAPELLEALKNLEKEFRKVYPIYYYAEPWGHETNVPLQAARAIITKAEGVQS
jgi:hypothetical protein